MSRLGRVDGTVDVSSTTVIKQVMRSTCDGQKVTVDCTALKYAHMIRVEAWRRQEELYQ